MCLDLYLLDTIIHSSIYWLVSSMKHKCLTFSQYQFCLATKPLFAVTNISSCPAWRRGGWLPRLTSPFLLEHFSFVGTWKGSFWAAWSLPSSGSLVELISLVHSVPSSYSWSESFATLLATMIYHQSTFCSLIASDPPSSSSKIWLRTCSAVSLWAMSSFATFVWGNYDWSHHCLSNIVILRNKGELHSDVKFNVVQKNILAL